MTIDCSNYQPPSEPNSNLVIYDFDIAMAVGVKDGIEVHKLIRMDLSDRQIEQDGYDTYILTS